MISPVSRPVRIDLPDPCLVVLVGAAGSGKSTFAGRHFRDGDVLSSDAYRERISGDAADQRATGRAFAALHRDLRGRLASGRLTVVDATNVTGRARASLVRIARAAAVPAFAIVLAPPVEVALAQNAGRPGRVVPERVIRRHVAELERSLRGVGLEAEGFASVTVLAGLDGGGADGVEVVVGGRTSPRA
jgi:protein phosphatase